MAERFIQPNDIIAEIEEARLINLIPDGSGSYSTPKLQLACTYANGQAEAYVGTRYDLPIALPYAAALKHHTIVLAVYWIHSQSDQVTDALTSRWKETIRWFEKVANGGISLGAEPPEPTTAPDFEEVTQEFSTTNMRTL